MATKKYNPYNAVNNIVQMKGKYHTAKDLGGEANQYHTAATPYYLELTENGYGNLADELTASDYTKSLDILGRYKPDSEFNIDSIYSDLLGESANVGTGKTKPVMSDSVSKILDSFSRTDNNLNGEIKYDANGNIVSGLNLDHYNTGKNQLDYLNNFDYTKQSYYDPIMQSYQLKGSDAAKGQLASGASSNAGNIDSYAAANANRQQLAFTNAGHEAARAAAQQNQTNWQTLYDAMSGNLSDMGQINAQNLATGANMYATDSAERQNALGVAAGLATDEATRRINQYLAELENDTTRYEIAANNQSELDRLIQQLNAQIQMNNADNATSRYGIDAETAMNAANNQSELERLIKSIEAESAINSANNQNEIDRLIKQIEGEKELAEINNQNEIDKLLLQLQGGSESKISVNELATQLVSGILEDAEEFKDINDWSDVYAILASTTNDSEGAGKAVEDMKKQIPDLFSKRMNNRALLWQANEAKEGARRAKEQEANEQAQKGNK